MSNSLGLNRYHGLSAALGTMHCKEKVISPEIESSLGITVRTVKIHTDRFGTFSGEIPRSGSRLETAILKAKAAMLETGCRLGIASEGSITSDPQIPLLGVDLETIVFIDSELDLVIHESIRSNYIVAAKGNFSPADSLEDFLLRADFPNHGLLVRPENHSGPFYKGISSLEVLKEAISVCSKASGRAVVENDFRANFSPSRMSNIKACTEKLVKRILSSCPDCVSPGYGKTSVIFGLPCRDCGEISNNVAKADVHSCAVCLRSETFKRLSREADPRFCDCCNP